MIRHENILKILDINASELKRNFIGDIEIHRTWHDKEASEHIYSCDTLLEQVKERKTIFFEHLPVIEEITQLCRKHGCSYFRITDLS